MTPHDEFMAFVQKARVSVLLRDVADWMDGREDWHKDMTGGYNMLRAYHAVEGWPGVLNVIAQALRENPEQL